jgi:hypothetical protein
MTELESHTLDVRGPCSITTSEATIPAPPPGPTPVDFADQPVPTPSDFGLPTEDDGSRDDPLMKNIVSCTHYRHDF